MSPEAAPAAAVVDAFYAALGSGDEAAARALISDDVLIFESGGVERSAAEYAAHHLPADAKFAAATTRQVISRTGGASANAAWITTEGRTTGKWNGKAIDSLSTETMLLVRTAQGWRIKHIHWSSQAAPKQAQGGAG
jgi:ketosteroid isomerase-like protein